MNRNDRAGFARTAGAAIGTALTAVLMVALVTFGANVIRPATAPGAAGTANGTDAAVARADRADRAGHGGAATTEHAADHASFMKGDEASFRSKPTAEPTPKSEPTPSEKPMEQPQATAKPTAKPSTEPTEKPAPVSTSLSLEAWAKDGKAKLAWSKYLGEQFEYYKLVRSADADATWPTGGDDTLIAAISDRYSPYAVDKAPCGVEWHYRVFAVKHGDGGYVTLAASNTAALVIECVAPTPPPGPPVALNFTATQAEGGVQLTWSKCTSGTFAVYKVVRSATDPMPTYPLNDGDELLAAIGDANVTGFVDGGVASGQTWTYRVVALGEGDGGWVVLCATDPQTIAVS